ncbi:MAG: hypothetical protein R2827_04385 [Bdellovibrionales bacterium]
MADRPTRLRLAKNVTVNDIFLMATFGFRKLQRKFYAVRRNGTGLLLYVVISGRVDGEEMVITGVNNARFRKPVVPGDILSSKIRKFRYRLAIFDCTASVDGEVVSRAEIMASRANTRA